MANIFWNRNERRVRAGWRILVQMILYFILAIFLATIPPTIIATTMAVGQSLDPSTPQFVAEIQTLIYTTPWLRILNSVLAIGGGLLVLWLAGRFLDRRKFSSFGFHFNRSWWLDFAFGLALGAILMVFIFIVELAAGWITITGAFYMDAAFTAPFWAAIVAALIYYIQVGINEEILSRGYQLRNIAEGLHIGPISARTALVLAYIISSSVFGLMHLDNPNASLLSSVMIALAGIMLGMGYVLTGELAIPIGLHISWNFFQGNVFGLPVSGGASALSFIAVEQGGPDLWTGGAFGPEAGLIGLIAMLLGIGLTYLWVKSRYGKVNLLDQLAVYQPGE